MHNQEACLKYLFTTNLFISSKKNKTMENQNKGGQFLIQESLIENFINSLISLYSYRSVDWEPSIFETRTYPISIISPKLLSYQN